MPTVELHKAPFLLIGAVLGWRQERLECRTITCPQVLAWKIGVTRPHLRPNESSSHPVSGMHVRAVVMARMQGLTYQLRPLDAGNGTRCQSVSMHSASGLSMNLWPCFVQSCMC